MLGHFTGFKPTKPSETKQMSNEQHAKRLFEELGITPP